MNLYKDIQTWTKQNETINCIIEIPKNSMVKYEFNKDNNTIEVDRFFTTPMPIPYNYGLIPQTYNEEDKDPLDVIILSNYEINPGSLCEADVIGILHMIDSGESDDKVIAIPKKEPFYGNIKEINEIPENIKNQREFFLSYYKKLDGKSTEVTGWSDKHSAIEKINKCIDDYNK
ncbi:inorganic diphosphatase [Candidatus Absconditicoccus praedator]|uniref:inorganic diphosphatase n=1 Tax=Candidatus Absconditicoccus praedator TaxID=2735562 RepID=UPI001E34B837|nr:inorganic diphosphatase [Candidatus Absconditicoccus praedator]UFX82539.1 inorganic diphosphatase [Candidatus Absconditicoccus praedator]